MHHRNHFYVDGRWVDPLDTDRVPVVSPFSEEIVGSVPAARIGDLETAIAGARRAFDHGPWPRTDPGERADVLDRAADLLEPQMAELASLITAEMGSTITFSSAVQVPGPIAMLRSTAALVRAFSFEEERGDTATRSHVVHEPVGVVAAIVPSNFPLMLAVSQVATALGAGCTVVLKPAPETPLDAYVLAQAFHDAGLPAGALNVIPGGAEIGDHLVGHPDVDKVAYTGSTAVGRHIAERCADRLTRLSLELGGKSAAVVLDDAPVPETVAALLPMAYTNNGQACVAQTRIVVPDHLHAEYVAALVAATEELAVGDPADPGTDMGPLLAERQRTRVEHYLELARDEGAKVATGGGRPSELDRGWFVEPTVLTDVDNTMRVVREEIFGPVLTVLAHDGPDHAIAIANDSDYGLSGSVWSTDLDAAVAVARRLRTGMVSINGSWQASDAPFGGVKRSGLGRECGPEGLRLYLEPKSIGLPVPA